MTKEKIMTGPDKRKDSKALKNVSESLPNSESPVENDPIKSKLEKADDELRIFNKEVDSLKEALITVERVEGKTAEGKVVIEALKGEIEKMEKDRMLKEYAFVVVNHEKRIFELEKLLKEGKTFDLGLGEDEAKKALEEMQAEGKNPAVKSSELIRSEKNIAELEKDIEATKRGLSSSNVDIRMKMATLAQLKKERDAMLKESVSVKALKSSAVVASPDNGKGSVEAGDGKTENTPAEEERRYVSKSAEGVFKETYEKQKQKEKGGSRWGWLKERMRGFITLGLWEAGQAKMFRGETEETAGDIAFDARKIQQTEVLDLDSALDEAEKMREDAKKEGRFDEKSEKFLVGKTFVKGKKDRYLEKYSQNIDRIKKEENGQLILKIVEQSTKNLEKQLREYKDQYGDSAVTTDKLDAFRKRLRAELESLQRGFIFNDELEGKGELAMRGPSKVREAVLVDQEAFKKTIRKSLDPKYWKRYVYIIPGAFLAEGFMGDLKK